MNIPATIYRDALANAIAAAKAEDTRLGPEIMRGLDCGFAWVDVPTPRDIDAHTKAFVKWCKAEGKGAKKGYGKSAWQFWNPAGQPTQSISVHMAGAQAFGATLRNNGIHGAIAASRLD